MVNDRAAEVEVEVETEVETEEVSGTEVVVGRRDGSSLER